MFTDKEFRTVILGGYHKEDVREYIEVLKKKAEMDRERRMQEAMLTIKKKYGKSAILKGMNLEEGATAKERNSQIGGHKA